MNITAPVTDYIRASLLTTEGDTLRRGAAIPERIARPVNPSMFISRGAVAYPAWQDIAAGLNRYFVAQGAGNFPGWTNVALRHTGIHIDNDTRNVGGGQVITGVGFEPSIILFGTADGVHTNKNWSIGAGKVGQNNCLTSTDTGTLVDIQTATALRIWRDVNNYLVGIVTATGADGFTITWTLVGACQVVFVYWCFP